MDPETLREEDGDGVMRADRLATDALALTESVPDFDATLDVGDAE